MYEEYKQIIDDFLNNKEVKKFLSKFNKKMYIPYDSNLIQSPIMDYRVKLFMIQSGIPMGAIRPIDKNKKIVCEGSDRDATCYEYKPLNNIKQYIDYMKKYSCDDLLVNPNFLPYEKVQHITYCLSFITDDKVFDMETQNKMQMELMKSVPINYDIAMKIFNKYYTKEIQKKIIYQHNLKIEKFYELSGLNKLVKNETQKAINKQKDRDER